MMLVCKMTTQDIIHAFGENYLSSLLPFRDAGVSPADYQITVVDILVGLHLGRTYGWV
jgi:hypothetical protein